jgi:hypothetical protein
VQNAMPAILLDDELVDKISAAMQHISKMAPAQIAVT